MLCRALEGIRAMRGQEPIKPEDPFLLRDLTALLIDCGLSPEEAFRLRWDELRDGVVHVAYGKTVNARRRVPLSARVSALLEMRQSSASSEWVFPSHTASGHAERSTPKKQHKRAFLLAKVQPFTLYPFRHTCLTRWAAHLDPYTLAYRHSDFGMTRRYVHPQADTIRAAMERAQAASRGSASFGHSGLKADTSGLASNSHVVDFDRNFGRGEWIRTTDLLVPNQAL
jgi:integrase